MAAVSAFCALPALPASRCAKAIDSAFCVQPALQASRCAKAIDSALCAEPALISHLGQALGVDVQNLDLNRLVDVAEPLTPEQQARSLLAIGAALRFERATL